MSIQILFRFITSSIARVVLLVFGLIACHALQGQINGAYHKVYRSLNLYTEKAIQTKAYLHLDKELYGSGETIWFKSYLISEPLGLLDSLSSNLYVELVDSNSQIVQRQTVYLSTGLGNGSLDIPEDLLSGLYYIRAYTKWMRNFDQELFHIQPIEIQNTEQELPTYQPEVDEGLIDLQFFPEGGDWLAGINANLAFKAIDAEGRGVDFEATIYDAGDDSVGVIKPRNAGMGLLNFTPESQQYYYARIKGIDKKYDLPAVKKKGFHMRVDNSYDNLVAVRVTALDMPEQKGIFLVVQSDGIIYSYVSRINFDAKNQALISIPKKHLSTGVNHFTLFNASALPECERLVYIDKGDQLNLSVNLNAKSLGKREKVSLDVKVTDQQGKPLVGSFSMAVVDENYKNVNRFSGNIVTELQLKADLKGHIEDPMQYFDPENEWAAKDLDLLMLTQGWRRFTWKDLLSKPVPTLVHQPEVGLAVAGRAYYNNKKQLPVVDGKVSYFNLDAGLAEGRVSGTDSEGKFSFNDLYFDKGSGASIKAEDKRGRENIMIEIEQPLINLDKVDRKSLSWLYYPQLSQPGDSGAKGPSYVLPSDYRDLGSVTVTGAKGNGAKAKKAVKSEYGSRVFDVDELLENTSGQRSVLDLLVGQMPSLSVIRSGSAPEEITVRDTRGQRRLTEAHTSSEPLYLLDGQTIEQSMAANIPANMISSLEVLIGPPAAVFGVRGMNGVIVLTSKDGAEGWTGPPLLGLAKLERFGYDYSRDFYSPRYDVKDERHNEPDKRSLLYWAPNIVTDANGVARLTFFTGDLEGSYQIDLQGIAVNGKLGVNTSQSIQVK